jgi:hypothetical protein
MDALKWPTRELEGVLYSIKEPMDAFEVLMKLSNKEIVLQPSIPLPSASEAFAWRAYHMIYSQRDLQKFSLHTGQRWI